MTSYSSRRLVPNAPAQNNFSALTVLKDGRLVGGNANGISILSNEGWRNILEVKKLILISLMKIMIILLF